ncbi:MAG: (4Fe-4S)-binding protein [Candidatus Wallbacteria bacterium HGW-Wallbacteria-1]|uniref:(4Fe-4S)-binding protein n=1 Tax=Candidatus Wallbacteria bacterium HGW-Wallbacteria-1 TaxID=2013854 RepID=A0A2N1PLG9_9BACT|nr:MAG: (4Fe-4S)-binding protein [Candidatus Wallbacteria bacterium HGW-Wallbacteria-1]
MRELIVISGKGGTGKTSITGAFASLAVTDGGAVIADCDVDASDLHLLLRPEVRERHEFIAGHQALIDSSLCNGCGVCENVCRFGAITVPLSGEGPRSVKLIGCEGCGVCVRACPEEAIMFPDRNCGEWFISRSECGTLVHARLSPGAENSGKLVTLVRRKAREIAAETGIQRIIVDGPPGIGCPVISSITGASLILAVTEPTLSGEHDLHRVMDLARHFGVTMKICVNRWDINPEITLRIERMAHERGIAVAGRIPFDLEVPGAQVMGRNLIDYSNGQAVESIREIWKKMKECEEWAV